MSRAVGQYIRITDFIFICSRIGYSAVMWAFLAIRPSRSRSLLMNATKLSTEPPAGSMPFWIRRSRISAFCMPAVSSAFMRLMIAGSVPFGAKMPAQWPMRTSGKPCSAVVGIFGAAGMCLSHVAPSALSLPALICGSTTIDASDVAATWPPITAVMLSEPLLYGTTVRSAPFSLSISSTKWGVLPLPAVANGTPPCFFEYSISSLTLFTGSE
uniref:Uncharacterized protein n=1 Tax=Solanum lycopersicum TaxID=4081 RepID=A0A494G9Y9_SOLLC